MFLYDHFFFANMSLRKLVFLNILSLRGTYIIYKDVLCYNNFLVI